MNNSVLLMSNDFDYRLIYYNYKTIFFCHDDCIVHMKSDYIFFRSYLTTKKKKTNFIISFLSKKNFSSLIN